MVSKLLYKDFRTMAAEIIARPMFGWFWTGTHWSPADEFKLSVLCEADADIEAAADAIGRKPTSIAHRARDTGLTLPQQWSKLIMPKRIRKPREAAVGIMPYPYISKANSANADLLAIDALVPKGMPEHIRADVCQEVMIAILEGRTTLEALRSRKGTVSYFIRRFYKDNYEDSGRALSFSVEDERSYDEIASARGLKDDYHDLRVITHATQLDAVWRDQVGRFRLKMNDIGQFLSREEAEELLDAA